MINKITEFILSNINWIGVDFVDPAASFEPSGHATRQVRVLDYACGPGTVTHAIGNRATEYIGIDLSENMVKAYNAKFSTDDPGTEKFTAHAVVGNLLEAESPPSLAGSEFFNFDLAAVGMGFHHFEDVELATKRLVERLKPGGVFVIIDVLTHPKDYSNHPGAPGITHDGFSDDQIKKIFNAAGLVDVDVVQMDGQVLMKGLSPRTPFIARGRNG